MRSGLRFAQPPLFNHTVEQQPGDNCVKSTSDIAQACNQIRKWNLKFDGDKNPVSFIERLNELAETYEIRPPILLKALPELFKGDALLWYRNKKESWYTYDDFLVSFEDQYLPPDYSRRLDEEIQRRTQGDEEPIRKYVVALTTLLRRRGRYNESEILDRVYTNMKPEYKLTIRRGDLKDLGDLTKKGESYESYLRDKRNYRPPPNPAQSLAPETAYASKSRFLKSYRVDAIASEVNTHREEKGDNVVKDASVHRRDSLPHQAPQSKTPSRQDNTRQSYRNPQERNFREPSVPTCWNCEKRGHRYNDCWLPKKLKCFNCKTEGVRTVHCPCRSGNATRDRKSGGDPSLDLLTPPLRNGKSGSST
jgi:hypothetical protein